MKALDVGAARRLALKATSELEIVGRKSRQEAGGCGKYSAANRKESGAGEEVCAFVTTA